MATRTEVKPWRDEQTLRWLYCEREFGSVRTGDLLGCNKSTVLTWLRKHGIGRRTRSEAALSRHARREGAAKYRDADWLRREYLEKERPLSDIADECGCELSTVWWWLQEHDIETRPRGASGVGEDHQQWKGGHDAWKRYGPEWTEERRREARERDNYRCQGCGMSQAKHLEQHNTKLHVHHIVDPETFDTLADGHDLTNLVTLCAHCHQSRWEGIPLRPQLAD